MKHLPMTTRWTARITAALAALALSAGLATQAQAAQEEVNIFFWFDYIPTEVIDGFEEKTGIKVNYATFDTLEFLETKMLAGGSGYDVVLPSALIANRLMQVGALTELDQSKLPNRGNLDPKIMAFLAYHDEGNRFGVPYLWGTTGITYNPALIAARMEDAPLDSLDMFFDPDVVSKFADCGVAMLDSPEEIMAIALNYLDIDPFTTDKADFKRVDELLAPIQPYMTHFNTSAIINDLAQGNLCLVLGWSGDAGIAYARALEADNGVEVFYSVPKEGTEIYFDFMSIPADAPNPDNAYTFMNYLMQPEVIASVTNAFYYPNGNAASLEFVIDEIKSDPNVYPTPEIMATLFPNLPRGAKTLRMLTRSWTRFKTGQ